VSGAGVSVNRIAVGGTTSLTANFVLDPAAAVGSGRSRDNPLDRIRAEFERLAARLATHRIAVRPWLLSCEYANVVPEL